MSDNAHDVGLATFIVDGVAHGFAIDGQALVVSGVNAVPFLQSLVEAYRIDADKHIADDRQARHAVAAVSVTALEALACLLSKAVGPIEDGLVSTHATQGCRGGDGQNGCQAMASALRTPWIGDVGKKLG